MLDLSSHPELTKILACLALNPGLGSILIFDAPYQGLQEIAALLTPLLTATTESRVQQVTLSSFENDDDVWGNLYLPGNDKQILKKRRLFTAGSEELQLITIADLSRLNQATARTCVMLVGADVVHLERNGQHEIWKPQQYWLVGCSSQNIGAVSPHLLDRFAVRLFWKKLISHQEQSEQEKIADLLINIPNRAEEKSPALPDQYIQEVKAAARRQVELNQDALREVLEYIDPENYYPRRTLALARFALALAQWEGKPQLTPEHVEKAAELLGFINELAQPGGGLLDSEMMDNQANEEKASIQPGSTSEIAALNRVTEQHAVYQTEIAETTDYDFEETQEHSYLEDTAPIEREAASLKTPHLNYTAARQGRGAIYGIEESDTITDLSLIGTLISAAKFQAVRQQRREQQQLPPRKGFSFEPVDLHRYRRGETSELLFLLLLDYTSVGENENWQVALLPYLREAYIGRAEVTIVKVGASNAPNPLQAEILSARNIMVQQVDDALYSSGKGATPLAHGLALCRERLYHVLQHGRNTVQRVLFVVVSDGRGNVPLQASLQGRVTQIVTREGIEDALAEARKIQSLRQVETIVLSPPLEVYTDLPKLLAEALGAIIQGTIESEPAEESAL